MSTVTELAGDEAGDTERRLGGVTDRFLGGGDTDRFLGGGDGDLDGDLDDDRDDDRERDRALDGATLRAGAASSWDASPDRRESNMASEEAETTAANNRNIKSQQFSYNRGYWFILRTFQPILSLT